MAGPRNPGIVLPKPSACHAKGQHACQSAAPATNTSEASFVQFVIQIATMIFCIFCPDVSQCPERTKKVVLSETDNVLRFSPGKIFCLNIQQLRPCRTKLLNVQTKNLPRVLQKKTAMPPDKLLTVVAPSNPHFKVATEKGWTYLTWMAVFSEGRWGQPERNNFEVGGHGGIPRLNLQFYRMAVFYEEPGKSHQKQHTLKTTKPVCVSWIYWFFRRFMTFPHPFKKRMCVVFFVFSPSWDIQFFFVYIFILASSSWSDFDPKSRWRNCIARLERSWRCRVTYAAWERGTVWWCLVVWVVGCVFNKRLPPQTKMRCCFLKVWEDGCLTFFSANLLYKMELHIRIINPFVVMFQGDTHRKHHRDLVRP